MKSGKHVLFLLMIVFLFLSFSMTSIASTSTSDQGISFTEEEKTDVDSSIKVKKPRLDIGKNRKKSKNSNFPQTGEKNKNDLIILGLIIILSSTTIIQPVKKGIWKMKRSVIILTGLISTGVLLGSASLVHAAPQDKITGSADGQSATSHGYVNLTPGDDDSTKPTDPTVPDGETENKGILTIDNVAPLLFGTNKLEGSQKVYTSTVVGSNVQVTDKRGEEAGWNVQVSQTEFIDQIDATKVLKGVTLVLPLGTLRDLGNVSAAPLLNSVEVNAAPATFMNAKAGSGAGTWTNIFDNKEIKLTVPAGNKKGEYMSTVTWSLMDAPA